MAIFRFRCTDELKARIEGRAKKANVKPSELARIVFEKAFPESNADNEIDEIVEKDAAPENCSKKITLRLTPTEDNELARRGKLLGMGKPTWVVRLIRAHLTKQPQLTDIEVRVLREATRELSYAARNLNQIACALNANLNEKDRISIELIREIDRRVEEVRGHIKAVFIANFHRWKL